MEKDKNRWLFSPAALINQIKCKAITSINLVISHPQQHKPYKSATSSTTIHHLAFNILPNVIANKFKHFEVKREQYSTTKSDLKPKPLEEISNKLLKLNPRDIRFYWITAE